MIYIYSLFTFIVCLFLKACTTAKNLTVTFAMPNNCTEPALQLILLYPTVALIPEPRFKFNKFYS